jgi:predicted ester cyclase
MTLSPAHLRKLFEPVRRAMADFPAGKAAGALSELLAPDATVHACHPFGSLSGSQAFFETAYLPLLHAWPDLERRDWIIMAGKTAQGAHWLGAGGHYMGTFARHWLDIPPTGHAVAMRFHEFWRFEEGRVVEVQAIWDIPEVMMQAGAWPLAPSLGREWLVPGPMTQDGLADLSPSAGRTAESLRIVFDMLTAMKRHPSQGGPEVMELQRYWHPALSWYGPAGIGTARGIAGFRNWHQIPFLEAMPDRGKHPEGLSSHLFAEGDYVAVTGWPNMRQTITGGGWLGMPPTGRLITMKSLDFWRLEGSLIRENWVLIDLLEVFAQLGLDALARMREFNKARSGFDPETGRALS